MSSHQVIYLISQWHPGNEWCLQEMNTAQPMAMGKPQEKILEIMYFSALLPSGKEWRERALLTLQEMELRWHQACLAGRSSVVLLCLEGLRPQNNSRLDADTLNLSVVGSGLDSFLLARPTILPGFLTTQVTSSLASLSFPLKASEAEGGKHTWISSPINGKPGKLTAFYWDPIAWIHHYVVTCKAGAYLGQVTSLGTKLRSALQTEGEKRYFISKQEP